MTREGNEEGRKNIIRRLYDIVNVFQCVGLIKKVRRNGMKMGYQWLGYENMSKMCGKK
jgi:hypothetical protein